MGLLGSIFLRTASDKKLAKRREKIWKKESKCYDVEKNDKYFTKRLQYDDEMLRRAKKRYEKQHPNAKVRHREHGWYLPNDD